MEKFVREHGENNGGIQYPNDIVLGATGDAWNTIGRDPSDINTEFIRVVNKEMVLVLFISVFKNLFPYFIVTQVF